MIKFRKRITKSDVKFLKLLKIKTEESKIYYQSYKIDPNEFYLKNGQDQDAEISFIAEGNNQNLTFELVVKSTKGVTINGKTKAVVNGTLKDNLITLKFKVNFPTNIKSIHFFDIILKYEESEIYIFESSVQ